MHKKPQRKRGFWATLKLRIRQWRILFHSLGKVLNPTELAHLVITTFWIRPRELFTRWYVHGLLGGMPDEFLPSSGVYIATIVLAVGLDQDCSYAYWLARRLAHRYHCRVLVLRSLTDHDQHETSGQAHPFFYRTAWLNLDRIAQQLQADYGNDVPLMAIGFSKGGLDVTILNQLLLENHGIVLEEIFTLSTPWQGSRLWQKSRVQSGRFFKPGSKELMEVEAVGQNQRVAWGVRFYFYTAIRYDHVVHPSDARFRRPPEDHGINLPELQVRWYYAKPLRFQYGHTALFNWWAHRQLGQAIHEQLRLRSSQDPAARSERRREALAFSLEFHRMHGGEATSA